MIFDNIMLDLETMGTGPNSAIVAIGAVEFDLQSGRLGEEFYTTVNLTSSVESGGVVDASTVLWWLEQSEAARLEITKSKSSIEDALTSFADWLHRNDTLDSTRFIKVWGNGADFDNVILSNSYRRLGMIIPWRYSGNRCYRTIMGIYPKVAMNRVGVHHNALDDARSQAVHLIETMKGEPLPTTILEK